MSKFIEIHVTDQWELDEERVPLKAKHESYSPARKIIVNTDLTKSVEEQEGHVIVFGQTMCSEVEETYEQMMVLLNGKRVVKVGGKIIRTSSTGKEPE